MADGMAAEQAAIQEQTADLERRHTAAGVAKAEACALAKASSIAADEREQALAARAEELRWHEAVLVCFAQLIAESISWFEARRSCVLCNPWIKTFCERTAPVFVRKAGTPW